MLWIIALVILFGNALPAWYLSTVHQKGPISLMPKLRDIAQNYRDENEHRAKILFLMPCHSTPYYRYKRNYINFNKARKLTTFCNYSHIHENVTMRFLTCEPNLKQMDNYKDEADRFYESPKTWIRSNVPSYPRTAMPSHVVMYEPLASQLNEFLLNYKVLERIENAEVNKNVQPQILLNEWTNMLKDKKLNVDSLLQHVQSRTGKNIVIYQRLKSGEENTFNRAEFVDEAFDGMHIPGAVTDEDQIENHPKNAFN